MAKDEKLYNKIKNNPRDVAYEEIHKLLIKHGFTCRNGSRASHFIYKHEKLKEINQYVNIPLNKPIKVTYILKALQMIDILKGMND